MLTGKHLIAGEWMVGEASFENGPLEGTPDRFALGNPHLVDLAAKAADDAFESYGRTDRYLRANFLRTIASEIDALGDRITAQGVKETGLAKERLIGERGRTIGQLRLFADHIEKDDYLDLRHDKAMPERTPLARPDLKMIQRPIGPVGVFGASNFPLAFSTAGGDTAAALAAGCPVIVKGHGAHPGVCDLVSQAIDKAIKRHGLHPGVFSQVQGSDRAIGEALVKHPLIQAIGFTGSTGGGRALFNLCAARPEPIPFFGELGSVNPVFMLPHALLINTSELAQSWVQSLALGAGQFCTNPGVIIALKSADADAFIEAAASAAMQIDEQAMLSDQIAGSFHSARQALVGNANIELVGGDYSGGRFATPAIFKTSASNWRADEALHHEVFGPVGIVVMADSTAEMLEVAKELDGQLTCTIHHGFGDAEAAKTLLPILERKAGRIVSNGFPTGVEVCDAMVHGGPYPASTNFGATSVGTLSIRRFLRPVCYQDWDAALLSF